MNQKIKTLAVLGSTGSIGTQTIEVARRLGYKIAALTAHSNVALLAEQADATGASVFTADTEEILHTARTVKADIIVNAIVGSAGLAPTLAALENPNIRRLALANKESLVCAGTQVMTTAKERGVEIIPIDSEHSAIAQCLRSGRKREVRRLILTASGGPFRGRADLSGLTAADALRHPTWSMGAKITVDSATLMNKGFEVIEAHHLFGVPYDKISVIIHPQSIVHSMVEFADGAVIAQLGTPDMRLPIAYALTYPKRAKSLDKPLDLAALSSLTFEPPDMEIFPLLPLAYRAGVAGDVATSVMCRANDVAVAEFLRGEIELLEIFTRVYNATEPLL